MPAERHPVNWLLFVVNNKRVFQCIDEYLVVGKIVLIPLLINKFLL